MAGKYDPEYDPESVMKELVEAPLVDPDKKVVTVYDFEHDNMEEYSFGMDIPVSIYEGFTLKVE